MKWDSARKIALQIARTLDKTDKFRRVHLAGSIRRMKPEVKDIEIVAESNWAPIVDMFGKITSEIIYSEDINIGKVIGAQKTIKKGKRYQQFDMGGINLDLFIVFPPASFGVIFTIRTGPAKFSKMIVTQARHGGYLENGYFVKKGSLWEKTLENNTLVNKIIVVDEEKDFFDYLIIDYLKPEDR